MAIERADTIAFTVHERPVGKGRPRFRVVGKGKAQFVQTYTPPETRAAEERIAEVAREAMQGRAMLTGPIRLFVENVFEPPASWSKRYREAALDGRMPYLAKPDWDNLGKVTDALDGIVWTSDALVVDGRSVKRYGEPSRVIITIVDLTTADTVFAPGSAAGAAATSTAAPPPPDRASPPRNRPPRPRRQPAPTLDLGPPIGKRLR